MSDHVLSSVAAEIAAGSGLSMSKVARRIGVNPATASRWVSVGLPDGVGGRRRLEAVRRGRVYYTSEGALARFFDGLPGNNNTRDGPTTSPMGHIREATLQQPNSDAAQATKVLKQKYKY